jgi:hypothetical protein
MTGKSVSTKQLLGTVVAVQANFYRVQMDEEEEVRSQESGVRSSEEARKNKEERNFSPASCPLPALSYLHHIHATVPMCVPSRRPQVQVSLVGQRALVLMSRTSAVINTTFKANAGTLGGFKGGGIVGILRNQALSDHPRPIYICDLNHYCPNGTRIDVNAADTTGCTALHSICSRVACGSKRKNAAILAERGKVMRMLLQPELGANVNALDEDDESAAAARAAADERAAAESAAEEAWAAAVVEAAGKWILASEARLPTSDTPIVIQIQM